MPSGQPQYINDWVGVGGDTSYMGYEVPLPFEIEEHRYEIIEEQPHYRERIQDVSVRCNLAKNNIIIIIGVALQIFLVLIGVSFFVTQNATFVKPTPQGAEFDNITKLESVFLSVVEEEKDKTGKNLNASAELRSKYNKLLNKYHDIKRQNSQMMSHVKDMNNTILNQTRTHERRVKKLFNENHTLNSTIANLLRNSTLLNASRRKLTKFINDLIHKPLEKYASCTIQKQSILSCVIYKHMKYNECVMFCEEKNSRIATSIVRDRTFLRDLQRSGIFKKYFAWIGLKRIPGTSSFVYSDGIASTTSNTPWKKGEPDNKYNLQNCGVVSSKNHQVLDMWCESQMYCMCQLNY